MQVTHHADHVTHAVIGGAETIEFGISNDAAFFQILSSTLYSDQRLAVAREVLCNAWDIHIRAKKTDVPIVVVISEKEIIVRDYGFGIAPKMMGPLYGTYGGTDKENNGTETGGFGLGCKSPFAYTDHFEVTSWFEGTKTIYNLSKSSADKMGKPGITPIVSLPCGSDVGLQVRIPLKSLSDQVIFSDLFHRVACNGEMLVNLNGTIVPGLPLSTSAENWLITLHSPLSANTSKLYVRYGNVIYPVYPHSSYQDEYASIRGFLDGLRSYHRGSSYKIIFQAEPNTISVTPSRESLSMQERTIKTVSQLLKSFIHKEDLDKQIASESYHILDRQIELSKEKRNIGALMCADKKIPGLIDDNSKPDLPHINNVSKLAEQFVRKQYPNDDVFYAKDIGMRLDSAIELGVGQRGHLLKVKQAIISPDSPLKHRQRLRKPLPKGKTHKHLVKPHEWFKRSVLRPLYRDMASNPVIEPKLLTICESSNYHRGINLEDPKSLHFSEIGHYLPILRRVLVLTYSKHELWDRIKASPDVKAYGSAQHVWVYKAPQAKTKIEAIREFFKKRGFVLIDFTTEIEIKNYRPVKDPAAPPRPKRTKLEGYPSLNGVYHLTKPTRVDNCFLEGQPRVKTPKLYASIIYSKAEMRDLSLCGLDRKTSQNVIKLFGEDCAVVRTKPQAEKLKAAGLMELGDYITNHICDRVTQSKVFQDYWTEDLSRAFGNNDGQESDEDDQKIATMLFDIKEVRVAIGLKYHLDIQDRLILEIWRSILDHGYRYNQRPAIIAAKQKVEAISKDKLILDFAEQIKNGSPLGLFSPKALRRFSDNSAANSSTELDRIAKITKIALLG